jgi:hypothetical protein
MRAPFREAAMGFAQVTVACEPTGHRWRVLGQLAADRQLLFVLSSQLACTTDLAWALRLVPLRSSPKRMTMRYSDDPHRTPAADRGCQAPCSVPQRRCCRG